MVYVPKGKQNLYDPRDRKTWKNYWVLFRHDAVKKGFKNLLPAPGVTRLNDFCPLEKHWNQLVLCSLENNESADEHAFCLLHNILYEISRQAVTSDLNKKSSSVQYALDAMQNNLREAELNFEKIAAGHGICVNTLRKKFQRETKVSLHQCCELRPLNDLLFFFFNLLFLRLFQVLYYIFSSDIAGWIVGSPRGGRHHFYRQ